MARETDTAALTSAAAAASPTGGQQGIRHGCGRSRTRTEPVRGQSQGRGRGAKRSVGDDSNHGSEKRT